MVRKHAISHVNIHASTETFCYKNLSTATIIDRNDFHCGLLCRYAVVQMRQVYWSNLRSATIAERCKLVLKTGLLERAKFNVLATSPS